MHFVIKLSPEIIVKSAPVRRRFIRQLRRNLRTLLTPLAGELSIAGAWDRIEIAASGDDGAEAAIAEVLARVPGIASYARVAVYPLGDFDAMAEQVWNHYRGLLPGRSFVVRVKRTGRHQFSSPEVERELGARLLARAPGARVSLREPQVRVSVEIVDARLYVIEHLRPGLGGFPLGQQPPVLSLISGGFDSTVATYLLLRRGLRTHFCFFNLGGRAHALGVREVAHYLWSKYAASHGLTFVTVPFEGVVAEILERIDDSLMGVVLKRMMLRAATAVARELGADALVTGESVAQVSSQTLPNLAVIDRATDALVLRPLIAMDKQDIIALARRIGTEPFAAHMPEYCGVISVRPSTHARLDRVERAEAAFDFAVLERALAARTREDIAGVLESGAGEIGVELFRTPQPDVPILDIRHPEECERRPLRAGGARIEAVPFFRLEQFFAGVPRDAAYLLYCDQGLMSRLHAELLVEQGFSRVGVYRP
jgi:tRNA uracil 4-sulfurtransferase